MRLLSIQSPLEWNPLILGLPNPHVLQTWEWGQSKIRNGWKPLHFLWQDVEKKSIGAALILERSLRLAPGLDLRVFYCPKGPVVDWNNSELVLRILDDLQAFTAEQKAVFLKMDPDIPIGWGIPETETYQPSPGGLETRQMLQKRGWIFSEDQIQFRNTVLLDLTQSEEALLSRMKQKTRYNIRLAARKGVRVRQGTVNDLSMLYQMYATTAVRDGFVIRHESYYTTLWNDFMQAGLATTLIAEVDQEPVAGLVLFHFAGVARYMFGMSLENQRELMPNYLLQWEAILTSRKLGCHTYDMWGAPDVFDPSDSMWGVYRFKEGFNGITANHIGAWDFTPRPTLYKLYTSTLPRILDIMRSRGKSQNRKRIL